jgi:hypothetical protein
MPDWLDGPRLLAVRKGALKLLGRRSTVNVDGLRIRLHRHRKPEGRFRTLVIHAGSIHVFDVRWSEDFGTMEYGPIHFGYWMDVLLERSAGNSNWSA